MVPFWAFLVTHSHPGAPLHYVVKSVRGAVSQGTLRMLLFSPFVSAGLSYSLYCTKSSVSRRQCKARLLKVALCQTVLAHEPPLLLWPWCLLVWPLSSPALWGWREVLEMGQARALNGGFEVFLNKGHSIGDLSTGDSVVIEDAKCGLGLLSTGGRLSWPHGTKWFSDMWWQLLKQQRVLYKGFMVYICFYYATFSSCCLNSCVGSDFDGSWISDLYLICSVNMSGIRHYGTTASACRNLSDAKQSAAQGGIIWIELRHLWGGWDWNNSCTLLS